MQLISLLFLLVACMEPKKVAPVDHLLNINISLNQPLALNNIADGNYEIRVYSSQVNGDRTEFPEYNWVGSSATNTITFPAPSLGYKFLQIRLLKGSKALAKYEGKIIVEPGKELNLGSIDLIAVPIEEQEAESQINLAIFSSSLGEVTEDTFFSISDIFDTYQCVVCHGEGSKLNLRSYPFDEDNELNLATLGKVINSVETGMMPPGDLKKVAANDLDRLNEWVLSGAKADKVNEVKDLTALAKVALSYKPSFQELESTEITLNLSKGLFKANALLQPDQYYDLTFTVEIEEQQYEIKKEKYYVGLEARISEILELEAN